MKTKSIITFFVSLLCAASSFAQKPVQSHNCDLSSFQLSEYFSEEYADVKCKKIKNFKPTKYIIGVQEVSFWDEEFTSYLQLITKPDAKGKSQHINILIQSEYADDAQLQGSGTGGYYIDGDKLYAYTYWDKGSASTNPYGVERYTYQWRPKISRYEIIDYVFSFYGGRSWGSTLKEVLSQDTCTAKPDETMALDSSCDEFSQSNTKPVVEGCVGSHSREESIYLSALTPEDCNKRFLWGEDLKALLTEAQQRIAIPIHEMLLRRQIAVCERANEPIQCCVEMPDPMNCLQSRYTSKHTTPPGFKPSAFIQKARIYEVAMYGDDPGVFDIVLITPPDQGGRSQYIPFHYHYPVAFGDYPSDAHKSLIHLVGGYTLNGETLTIYQYWGDGCAFDQGLALETRVLQWQPSQKRFEEQTRTFESISDKTHPRYQELKIYGLISEDGTQKQTIQLPEQAQTALAPLIKKVRQESKAYCRTNGLKTQN